MMELLVATTTSKEQYAQRRLTYFFMVLEVTLSVPLMARAISSKRCYTPISVASGGNWLGEEPGKGRC